MVTCVSNNITSLIRTDRLVAHANLARLEENKRQIYPIQLNLTYKPLLLAGPLYTQGQLSGAISDWDMVEIEVFILSTHFHPQLSKVYNPKYFPITIHLKKVINHLFCAIYSFIKKHILG